MSKKNPRELRSQREDLIVEAADLVELAETEERDFTPEEQVSYDEALAEADKLLKRAERLESISGLKVSLEDRKAPNVNVIPLGDSEARAIAHFARSGDYSVFEGADGYSIDGREIVVKIPTSRSEMRAVDSTMNITTAADGGSLVPTGFAGELALRKNERDLAMKLGLRKVTGKGTTVNFPYDNAEPVVFATASEQADDGSTNNYERDAMVIGTKAFTLVKKAKKMYLTEELLDDEDINVMESIADWIGRDIAATHNAMLLTEVASNGTSLKTFASASAIAAGEPEDIVGNNALGYYLDDGSSAAWVMRNPTFMDIASITGNARLYAETPGGSFDNEILGYPVFKSNSAAAIAASAKSAYFGDWYQVGWREENTLKLLVDPYSVDGITVLKYSFRAVFGVLQSGGIGYAEHPTA